jgi:PAS domain S-box-containing protein
LTDAHQKIVRLEAQLAELRAQLRLLSQAKDRQRQLYLRTPAMLHSIDPQGRLVEVSERWLKVMGYERHEVLGRRAVEFFAPKWRPIVEQVYLPRFFSQEHVEDVPVQMVSKDGEVIDTLISAIAEKDEQGRILRSLAVTRVVTAQKRAEAALRASEAQLRAILDGITANIAFVNPELEILWANRSAAQSVGMTPQEMKGNKCHALWADPAAPCQGCPTVKAIKSGKSEHAIMRTPDGRVWDESGEPVFGEDGELLGVVEIAQDITEQKKAEEALAASEARFRELVENIQEAFWVREPESGKLHYLSPAVEEVFGLSRQFLYDNPFGFLEMVLPVDRPVVERALADQRMRGVDTDIEYRIQRGDGRVRWIRARAVCVTGEQGKVVRVLGVAEDITERKEAQLALAKSQEKFSSVFRNSPLWMAISTLPDGVYLDVNDAFSEITGYSRQEVLGRTSKEIGIWADPFQRDEAVRMFKRQGSLRDFEIDYLTRSGELRHALWSAEQVFLDGRTCLISVLRDITRQKLAEEALRQTNATLELAQNIARLGNWSVDLISTRAVWSAQMFKIMGRDPLQGAPGYEELLSLIHPDDRERFDREIDRVSTTGEPLNLELRVVRPEGSVRHINVQGQAQCDGKGRVARLLGIVQDITERKRSEEALRASEEQFRRLFEDAVLGVFQSSVEGEIIRVNPAFARMFGYESPEELMEATQGREAACYADPRRREEVVELARGGSGPVRLENLYRRKDGSTFTGLQHLRLVRDGEGKPLRLEGFVEDVSRLKESQEARRVLERQLRHAQKMEAVGALAEGIVHDFNNLLAAIMGYSELAAADLAPDHPSQENLQQVLASTQRAQELVKQMLSLGSSAQSQQGPTRLAPVVEEVLRLLTPELPAGVKLDHRVEQGMVALADTAQLHQMMINLCRNSLQAMAQEGGTLSIRLERVELTPGEAASDPGLSPGPHARLEVSDTGQGMPAELQERVFEPFFTARDKGEGRGMGLAVVRGIVKNHGGAVSLRSALGRGTTVTVLLPLMEDGPDQDSAG